nr:MAG TPA: Baseplate structural protein [Caudoviricetes sp.]
MTVEELARHIHDSIIDDTLATDDDTRPYADAWYQATHWTKHYRPINNNVKRAGGDNPHNNVQPSRAAYVWFRVG